MESTLAATRILGCVGGSSGEEQTVDDPWSTPRFLPHPLREPWNVILEPRSRLIGTRPLVVTLHVKNDPGPDPDELNGD